MTTRRKILGAVSAGAFAPSMVLAPYSAFAQQPPAKVWRIAFLQSVSGSSSAPRLEALRAGLRDLGYAEGKNLVIETRWAEGRLDRLPELAAELVRLKPDVLVTSSTPAIEAAKRATGTIPIVMVAAASPVERGLIASLARPGGNVTGMTLMSVDIAGKWLQIARELRPGASRIGALIDVTTSVGPVLTALRSTAQRINVHIIVPPVKEAADVPGAFEQMRREGAQALIVQLNPLTYERRAQIVETAAKLRLPAVYASSEFADLGGLVSYGPNFIDMFRQSATYVDKIFKGAKPGDLPVAQPTTFEYVVNLKTAKTLGIKVPQTILLQATRVIE